MLCKLVSVAGLELFSYNLFLPCISKVKINSSFPLYKETLNDYAFSWQRTDKIENPHKSCGGIICL